VERANAEKSKDQAVAMGTTTMAAAAQMVAPIEEACKAGKAPTIEHVQNLKKKLEEGQNKLTESMMP
jgi:hypothetical protein